MNVEKLPCRKQRLLVQESWGLARNSVDILHKVLEDIAMGETKGAQEDEAMD